MTLEGSSQTTSRAGGTDFAVCSSESESVQCSFRYRLTDIVLSGYVAAVNCGSFFINSAIIEVKIQCSSISEETLPRERV